MTAGAVAPDDPDLIIAAIGGWESQQLGRSTDGGETWIAFDETVGQFRFIAFHPQDPDFVYADDWISSDRGETWQAIDRPVWAVFRGDGDVVYSTTLLPGEKVRLFTASRNNRFTYDASSEVTYRHEQASEETYYMTAYDRFMSQFGEVPPTPEESEEARRLILEQLIDRSLMLQESDRWSAV